MDKFMNDNSNSNSVINISDVIDVIQKEADYAENNNNNNDYPEQRQMLNMLSGGGIENVRPGGVKNSRPSGYHYQQQPRPYVVITEQPASKALRFRYECEGRSAGSIPGVNSTPENKTFPSIRIVGYKGRAVVVVSCVTKDLHDGKYRAHPHNLVGKEACKQGVCTVEVSSDSNMEVSFANLGIQCVKKRDIEEALSTREKLRVDPFRAGFDHKNQPTSIDLNAVRLCFQVFLEGDRGKFTVALGPVVSDAIYDKKAMSDLVICKLSHCSASAAGGTNMILLCEKVAKEDIQVRFFETKNGKLTWEAFAEFSTTDVHKQVGIAFKTPKYDLKPSDEPIEVFVQLRRPSDGAASEPRPFEMIPIGADDPEPLKRKRYKYSNDPESLYMLRKLQADTENRAMNQQMQYIPNLVKPEPMETMMMQWNPTCSPNAPGYSSPLYPGDTSPIPSPNMQHRVILSPRRTPSPLEPARYNAPRQYQPQLSQISPHFLHPNVTLNQPPSGPPPYLPPIEIPPNTDNNNQNNEFEMNSQQLNYPSLGSLNNINSAELALLTTALPENVFAGLSISEDTPQGANGNTNAAGEEKNMSDSFTRIVRDLQNIE